MDDTEGGTESTADALADALALGDRECVSFVGAGGKKTAMTHLVRGGTDRGLGVGYTTTTHTPPLDGLPPMLADGDSLPEALAGHERPLAFAAGRVADPKRADEKVRGYPPEAVDRVADAAAFGWLLVKADGARRREFKAPGPDEPVIPGQSTHVVSVASVRAVGEPLDEATVHRPERVAALTDTRLGETITPETVGRVLASEAGGCKSVPAGATVTPVVNKADTGGLVETARSVLRAAFERTGRFDRGLITSFETGRVSVYE